MNISLELNELFYTDTPILFKIVNLLRNCYGQEITKYLIYTDDNYLNYLKKISLDKRNNWIFYFLESETCNFVGFTIFKKVDGNIFLNHLVLDKAFQKKGLGKELFFLSLKKLESSHPKGYFKYLELEAFASNSYINKFYRDLEMDFCGSKNWYQLAVPNFTNTGDDYCQRKYNLISDENNFSQLIHNELTIGTFINNKYLRLNTEKINVAALKKISPAGICINTRSELNIPVIDRSNAYRSPFSRILYNLTYSRYAL